MMKKNGNGPRRLAGRAVFVLVCLAWLAAGAFGAEVARTAEDWRRISVFLRDTLVRKHPDLFFKLPQADYERMTGALLADLPRLSDRQAAAAWLRIVAAIGDEHTQIDFGEVLFGLRWPFTVRLFPEGVYVNNVLAGCEDLAGCRLLAVDDVLVEDIQRALAPFLVCSTEGWRRQSLGRLLASAPLLLQALGALPDGDRTRLRLLAPDGRTVARTVPLVAVPARGAPPLSWISTPAVDAKALNEEYPVHYFFRFWPDRKALYIRCRSCAERADYPVARLVGDLEESFRRQAAERVILDLRNNGGGDSRVLNPVTDWIHRNRTLNRPGHCFVLINAGTFSSAFLNAWKMKKDTRALLVGEATGQAFNCYGDYRTVPVPGTPFTLYHSTKKFILDSARPRDFATPLAPDLVVVQTAADYFGPGDAALEAALAYAPTTTPLK